jgi:regulator of telomere elongation helicase 1
MKNSAYNNVSAVSLGSRDQLCINNEVFTECKTNAERTILCQVTVHKNLCNFYKGLVKQRDVVFNTPIKDIEDLVTIGHKFEICPYHLSRYLTESADIIFMPYNYLLDGKLLKLCKIDLKGAIIILDEGHNVSRVCEESASIVFTSSDIKNCIDDITYGMKTIENKDDKLKCGDDCFKIEDLLMLKKMMVLFENEVNSIEYVYHKTGKTFPGGKLFELLEAADINISTYPMIRQLLVNLSLFLTTISYKSVFGRKARGVMKMIEIVETAFIGDNGGDSFIKFRERMERGYRVHVEIETDTKSSTTNVGDSSKGPKIINYWCFDPSFGMANIVKENVRSIILTSGTLAPVKPLINELGITAAQLLENPHIIKESQVFVKVVIAGPDQESLNGAYANHNNPKYIKSVGLTIQGISKVTPNGILVFFSSYTIMDKCHKTWEDCGIWNTMQQIKPIFKEPRNKDAFQNSIKEYYKTVKLKRGAIYMAVLRGKVSEGLDFKDHNARAVIICGIPFPPYTDPRVVLKKSYLDTNRNRENQLQSGREWYTVEGIRTVNQAIGRVIRHKDDFGAILLCDHRFQYYKSQLSEWIQPNLKAQSERDGNFGKIVGELAKFFNNTTTEGEIHSKKPRLK